jgi:hypothetical protein
MRYDAPFLVMRRSHPVARPEAPMRIAVEYQAYSLAEALKWAVKEQRYSEHPPSFRAWLEGSQRWIERRDQPARRVKNRRES